VEITEGARKASAEAARFEDASRSLFLKGAARVADPDQGSNLSAADIDLLGNGNVAARENVRHEMTPRGKSAPGPAASRQAPWLVTSRFLDYDAAARAGRYKENALLRSGDDEVRSDLLILEEPKPGQRRLRGQGSVVSLLHSRKTDAEGREKVERDPVETRSAELDYEEARRQVVYTGDVRIRQGDIATRSPQATAFLSEDGARVETIVAGEPVEVQQGVRQAKGTKGTYTVANETLLLVGEKVVLEEGSRQRLQGRSLTFHARDDTILVDGREVERTESVFRREPRRP
jgi:lipopolysaccharide transport protein LptA